MTSIIELKRVISCLTKVGKIDSAATGVVLLGFEISEEEMRIARENSEVFKELELEHAIFGKLLDLYNTNPIKTFDILQNINDRSAKVMGKFIELTMTSEAHDGVVLRRIYGRYVPGSGHTFLKKKIRRWCHVVSNVDRTIDVSDVAFTLTDDDAALDELILNWFEHNAESEKPCLDELRFNNVELVLKKKPMSGAFIYTQYPVNSPITKETISRMQSNSVTAKRIFVLYHADSDGRFAGYAAYRKLVMENPQPDVEVQFFEVQYGKPFPIDINRIVENDRIFILDFSYKRDILNKVYERTKNLVVLDHHKTAKDELIGLPYVIFDMTKSGALLAWEWFYPNEKVPFVCTLVNDRDLWNKEYPESRHLEAYLRAARVGSDWMQWHELVENYSVLESSISRGSVITGIEDSMIDKVFKSNIHKIINFAPLGFNHLAAIYNCPGLMHSEMAEKYYTTLQVDMTIAWRVIDDGVLFSLRSPKIVDCSAIAKHFGGGGHEEAAGFKLPFEAGFEMVNKLFNQQEGNV